MPLGILSGAFNEMGVSEEVEIAVQRSFNVSIDGGEGVLRLERQFEGEGDWVLVQTLAGDYQGFGFEPEAKTLYRFNCTTFTSGPINYRIGTKDR